MRYAVLEHSHIQDDWAHLGCVTDILTTYRRKLALWDARGV